ncbi:hypothetical protein QBC32DRAFT_342226 [Pseudoneurospora amorphoporcata]|uniref:Uncharacterized protein n=1 Tax=Pseudoneurospora amorphoporcata TaxID=241081 RepID=A0AAN6SFV3_9PEZI|nr:hypothetical protein QBC32DRAFT_342226 [Pseudoneurospora amorphoporcata]
MRVSGGWVHRTLYHHNFCILTAVYPWMVGHSSLTPSFYSYIPAETATHIPPRNTKGSRTNIPSRNRIKRHTHHDREGVHTYAPRCLALFSFVFLICMHLAT